MVMWAEALGQKHLDLDDRLVVIDGDKVILKGSSRSTDRMTAAMI
jgi:hypothetical protein